MEKFAFPRDLIKVAIELHKYDAIAMPSMQQQGVRFGIGSGYPAFSVTPRAILLRQRELLNRFVQFPQGDRDSPSQSVLHRHSNAIILRRGAP